MRQPLQATIAVVLCLTLIVPASTMAAEPSKEPPKVPTFVEEAAAAGVDHAYDGGFEFYVGGGVAVFDCDGDARPELYFAGGEDPAALFGNRSKAGKRLRFERLESEVTDLTSVTGAYPIDIDSDHNADLVVLRHGENVLLRGIGACRFERANEDWGFDGGSDWTTAFSATWEDGEAWPTLAFGTYIDHFDDKNLAHCGSGYLFRPNAAGDGFGSPSPLEPGHCALSMLFSDWDGSGRRDLRVANDRHYYYNQGGDQLWRVLPGTPPRLYTTEDGWNPLRIFGMGIASHDLTGDGYPEYFLSNMGDNMLQTLADGPDRPSFMDIAHQARATVTQPFAGGDLLPSTAWHAEFDDVNNDGLMDLFVAKGNVESMADHAQHDPNNLLLGRADGRFKEGAADAGILNYERSRGAALVDLNLDGLLDLVEVNRESAVDLRRNVGRGDAKRPKPMGHWLAVQLVQPGPNPDGIGSWIEVRAGGETTGREITIGGGHAGGELGPAHFGLGGAKRAEVRVRWPDGELTPWLQTDADRAVVVSRAEGQTATLAQRQPGS